MHAKSILAASAFVLSLAACGNEGALNDAATALAEHYAQHPPVRGWRVLSVNPETKSDKLIVDVMVTADGDIERIKASSRMEQFAIAKLACPAMTPALEQAMGDKTRIWVRLQTPDKDELTASICPQE